MIIRTVRHYLEYAALRLIVGLVRLLPMDTAIRWSAAAWVKLAPRGRRHQRALANLERAFPDKSPEARQQIALAMWENLGRVMVETMVLDRLIDHPERIEIEDPHMVDRYRGKIGPAVCVSLHMGNWELAMWPMIKAKANPAAVYRLVSNPLVENYLANMRKKLYPGGLFARGGKGGHGHNTARLLADYVRKGGRLGFLADLYDRKGVEVPFFGVPASSTVFPAMLARGLGCRMWISRCIRIGKGSNFKVTFREIKVPRSDDRDEDLRQITADVQKQFEDWIRENPEQWMWSNRKWS